MLRVLTILTALLILAMAVDSHANAFTCAQRAFHIELYDHRDANPRIVVAGEVIPAHAHLQGVDLVWIWNRTGKDKTLRYSWLMLSPNGHLKIGTFNGAGQHKRGNRWVTTDKYICH